MQGLSPGTGDPRLPQTSRYATSPRDDARNHETVTLVHAARAGDPAAWSQLVRRYDARLRRVARSYRLAHADIEEVVQDVWLFAIGSIHCVREPEAIGAWLTKVTQRTAMRRRQIHVREELTDEPSPGESADTDEPLDSILLSERRAFLIDAIANLPTRQRRLVTVLHAEPSLDYRRVGALLDMPIGSIGPIRGRALARLASDERLRAVAQ